MLALLFNQPKLQCLTSNTIQKTRSSIRSAMVSIESIAEVTETIWPNRLGRVYYQGSWWLAICLEPVAILEGRRVRVVARDNITLIVETLPNT